MLTKLAGTWDATATMMMPGMPTSTSKATMVYKPIGQTWVSCDYRGDLMGQEFNGHGVDGYDPKTKKFVSTWVDSMTTQIMMMEGTYDAASKTLTMTGECEDHMTGKMVTKRMTTEFKDADTMVMRMFGPGQDGKEFEGMKIEFKRRK